MASTYTNAMVNMAYIYRATGGGVTFSANLGASSATMDYFVDSPTVDDAIYFGVDANHVNLTGENGLKGAFHDLTFNVGTAIAATSHTLVWEYWTTGETWATLTVTDNTNGFTTTGSNTVDFTPPADWAMFNPGSGHALYVAVLRHECWVRVRLSAFSGFTEGGANQTDRIKNGENILRMTGTDTIEGMYDDDVTNGWGVITRTGADDINGNFYGTYFINAYVAIGDGSTATTITHEYGDIMCYRIFAVLNNASFELGDASGYGDPESSCAIHCPNMTHSYGTQHYLVQSGGSWTQWGGILAMNPAVKWSAGLTLAKFIDVTFLSKYTYPDAGGTSGWASYSFQGADVELDRCEFIMTYQRGQVGFLEAGMALNDLKIVGGYRGPRLSSTGTVQVQKTTIGRTAIENLEIQDVGNTTHYMDDCVLYDEDWVVKPTGAASQIYLKFRKTWRAFVLDADGNAIVGARIVCKDKDGNTEFDIVTIAGGKVSADQLIVRRTMYWNGGSGGPDTDTDHNPFTFEISYTGYKPVKITATMPSDTVDDQSWTISLMKNDIAYAAAA